jgi:hypothetical protein
MGLEENKGSDSDQEEENNHLNQTVNPQSKVTKPTKPI